VNWTLEETPVRWEDTLEVIWTDLSRTFAIPRNCWNGVKRAFPPSSNNLSPASPRVIPRTTDRIAAEFSFDRSSISRVQRSDWSVMICSLCIRVSFWEFRVFVVFSSPNPRNEFRGLSLLLLPLGSLPLYMSVGE